MIRVRSGDILESQAQTLVNTVNCVGVMGKGIALQFRDRFPDMYGDYVDRCRKGQVKLGFPYIYRPARGPWILNFPTKNHWRSLASLDDIVRGLKYLTRHYKEWGIRSIAVPPLGCGNGQLEWSIVGPTLYRHLSQLDIPVELYAPKGTPSNQMELEFLDHGTSEPKSKVPPPWLALAEMVYRLECQPYHWPIGRIMFQKMVYVATRRGLPTNLTFVKGPFGPYSPELKRLTSNLMNNGILVEKRRGNLFEVRVGPTFQDARRIYAQQLRGWEQHTECVADLFARLDARKAEIVATVMYSADILKTPEHVPTETDVLRYVMDWKSRRKPPMNELEVGSAIRNLACLGWLEVNPSAELPLD